MLYLLLLLFALAFLLQVDFIFYIGYILIGMMLWSRFVVPRQLTSLKLDRKFNSNAFWNEEVPVQVEVTNRSRFPIPWLLLQESVAVQLRGNQSLNRVVRLKGRETAVLTYTLKGKRRGYYLVGPMRLSMGDLFGLVPEAVGQVPPTHVTVYPRLVPLSKLGFPSRLPFGTIAGKQRLFEDPARPMGVRQFRSGDSIRQINWKTSAHTQRLMVKTYQPAISLETAILLDLYSDSYQRKNRYSTIEWAIVVAASLAAHLTDRQQPIGLITNGFDPLAIHQGESGLKFDEESGRLLTQDLTQLRQTPEKLIPPPIGLGNGRSHLMKILERLARLETEYSIPLTHWATTACMGLSWGTTIIVITPRGTVQVCQTIHRLVRSGYNPILLVVEPDNNFSEVRERARRLGFQAHLVADEKDLDEWRQPMVQ